MQTRVRRTHAERKQQTRGDLVATARRAFLERGFHGASLDAIAEEAGYSKGAVYSNFAGKDELFLAVLDDHLDRRAHEYADLALHEERLEHAYRAVARFRLQSEQREPRWEPLLLEYWTHASRREELRRAVSDRRERFLDAIARVIDELAERHGIAYALPSREIARGSAALLRGLTAERMLDPDAVSAELAEDLHVAYMNGLATR